MQFRKTPKGTREDTWRAEVSLRKHKNIFAFSIISRQRARVIYTLLEEKKDMLSYIVHTMSVAQFNRISAATVFILFYQNSLASVKDMLLNTMY